MQKGYIDIRNTKLKNRLVGLTRNFVEWVEDIDAAVDISAVACCCSLQIQLEDWYVGCPFKSNESIAVYASGLINGYCIKK